MMDRREALKKYELHKSKGLVDGDIIPLLDKINALECCYTTSSCSGRMGLMEIPRIGDKKNAIFIGKWHQPVEYDDILNALEKFSSGYLFLIVQSAIIHMVCETRSTTEKMMTLSRDAGFKYTSIKSIKNGRYLIEIVGSENIQMPIGYNGKVLFNTDQIKFLVDVGNTVIKRIKSKLKRFEEKISSLEPSFCT